ncbi:hypothetical protein BUALT_Bualt06G0105800 [Buddleja alternifolia]|uniref:Scarecrow-like protein 8 n=1 Tax=Buddleja alternifolia TaxID=168488 RepID=A0AAV6XLY8_9LAMI|nr:hypothetical protein BUALT_Bualt06G0105800 [Buddleja alternifolia]
MSSGFSGGIPDFFSGGRRSSNMNPSYNTMNLNPQQQFSLRSPLAGILPDPAAQIHRNESIGKRSLAEFQQQNQQGLGFYLRNVKPRPNYHHASPISPLSPADFSPVPNSVNSRYGPPILQQIANRNHVNDVYSRVSMPNLSPNKGVEAAAEATAEKNMMNHRLQELEKELLGDEEDGEDVSVVTNSEWSETIQNLISPAAKPISPTSSSSSCTSTSASPPLPCPKQSLIDAAVAISEGKSEAADEILTRLRQVANAWGTSEQRLVCYMLSALKARVSATDHATQPSGLYGKEHAAATQMLYDVSPCFKLGFMAANLAILEAASEEGFQKIHVVDFDIGQGGQYVHLLHALAAAKRIGNKSAAALSITTFNSGGEDKLKSVGEGLKALANKIGVPFNFNFKNSSFINLSRENLEVQPDEALAVNFAFKLYKLPDESVTTENLRDELLRRVKSLSPAVMTVVEQEMNGNTSPLVVRVRDACDYYGALFDSLDATVSRENSERVRIEEGLSRKMANSVACEGRDRVERCEVFGKWRSRMSMAGFKLRPMSQRAAESLRSKLNSGTRGNPGFTVNEQFGGIGFGWMGRTLTVASGWR